MAGTPVDYRLVEKESGEKVYVTNAEYEEIEEERKRRSRITSFKPSENATSEDESVYQSADSTSDDCTKPVPKRRTKIKEVTQKAKESVKDKPKHGGYFRKKFQHRAKSPPKSLIYTSYVLIVKEDGKKAYVSEEEAEAIEVQNRLSQDVRSHQVEVKHESENECQEVAENPEILQKIVEENSLVMPVEVIPVTTQSVIERKPKKRPSIFRSFLIKRKKMEKEEQPIEVKPEKPNKPKNGRKYFTWFSRSKPPVIPASVSEGDLEKNQIEQTPLRRNFSLPLIWKRKEKKVIEENVENEHISIDNKNLDKDKPRTDKQPKAVLSLIQVFGSQDLNGESEDVTKKNKEKKFKPRVSLIGSDDDKEETAKKQGRLKSIFVFGAGGSNMIKVDDNGEVFNEREIIDLTEEPKPKKSLMEKFGAGSRTDVKNKGESLEETVPKRTFMSMLSREDKKKTKEEDDVEDTEATEEPKEKPKKSVMKIFGSNELRKPKKEEKTAAEEVDDTEDVEEHKEKPKKSMLKIFGSNELKKPKKEEKSTPEHSNEDPDAIEKIDEPETPHKRKLVSFFGSSDFRKSAKTEMSKENDENTTTDPLSTDPDAIEIIDEPKEVPRKSFLAKFGSGDLKKPKKPKNSKDNTEKTTTEDISEAEETDEPKEVPKRSFLAKFGSGDLKKPKNPKKFKEIAEISAPDPMSTDPNANEIIVEPKEHPRKSLLSKFGSGDLKKPKKPKKSAEKSTTDAETIDENKDAPKKSILTMFGSSDLKKPQKEETKPEPARKRSLMELFGYNQKRTSEKTDNPPKDNPEDEEIMQPISVYKSRSESYRRSIEDVTERYQRETSSLTVYGSISNDDLINSLPKRENKFGSEPNIVGVTFKKPLKTFFETSTETEIALPNDELHASRESLTSIDTEPEHQTGSYDFQKGKSKESLSNLRNFPAGVWGPRKRSETKTRSYCFVGDEPEIVNAPEITLQSFKMLDDDGKTLLRVRAKPTGPRPKSYHNDGADIKTLSVRRFSFSDEPRISSDTESADHGSTDKTSVTKLTQDGAKKRSFNFMELIKRNKEPTQVAPKVVGEAPKEIVTDNNGDRVVYAELDMVRGAEASAALRRDTDPDKTEYAEIIHPAAQITKKEELRRSRENLVDPSTADATATPNGKKEAAV